MVEVLIVVAFALAAVLLGFVVAVFVRLGRLSLADPISGPAIAQLLRGETEILRGCGEEQARGLRQELGDNLRGSVRLLGENANATLSQFGDRLKQSVAAIETRVATIAAKLDADVAGMGEAATRNREGLRALVESKLDASATRQGEESKGLRDELGASFHRLSSSIGQTLADLGERQVERLDKNERAIEALSEKNVKSQEALKQTVEGRLDAIRLESATKLEEMRQTVDEKLRSTLETSLNEHVTRMFEQFSNLHKTLGEMKNLAADVGDLRNVLTNVKVRGTFGEVQLENLLEQFLVQGQYEKDVRVREHSLERVEFAIKYPVGGEEVLLPIDAKFPRETYERLVEASNAGDAALIESYRKQMHAQIKACAKEISEKYINPPRTTDHAILFLPTEGLFAEAVRLPGLMESIHREHKVTLAGPTTLAATLSAFQMGFRSMAIEKRSGEVRQLLAAVSHEFGKYNKVVEGLGRQLNSAVESVGKLGTRARVMTRTLKSIDSLPEDVSSAAVLGLEQIDADIEDEEAGPPSPIELFARAGDRH